MKVCVVDTMKVVDLGHLKKIIYYFRRFEFSKKLIAKRHPLSLSKFVLKGGGLLVKYRDRGNRQIRFLMPSVKKCFLIHNPKLRFGKNFYGSQSFDGKIFFEKNL